MEGFQPGDYELVFRSGKVRRLRVSPAPPALDLTREWTVRFTPGWGAPAEVVFPKLISWSEHQHPGVRYFSGTATYRSTIRVPARLLRQGQRVYLHLGRVEVVAAVRLNGKPAGVLWKSPFSVEVTRLLRSGLNQLEVQVANLWVNRMIGDEQLPEDSNRNPDGTLKEWPRWLLEGRPSPAGRYTFTTWRLWQKDSPLQPSGLLGPVRLDSTQLLTLQ